MELKKLQTRQQHLQYDDFEKTVNGLFGAASPQLPTITNWRISPGGAECGNPQLGKCTRAAGRRAGRGSQRAAGAARQRNRYLTYTKVGTKLSQLFLILG